MKCRIKQQNTLVCPKCKSKIQRNGRGFHCRRCGYYKAEEESNHEKQMLNRDYARFYW